jgi:hypothetical protein
MNKAKETLKAELMELYRQALDEMLEDCPEQANFAVLEEQVEKLAQRMLPETLSNLAQERGIFPPELRLLRDEAAKERETHHQHPDSLGNKSAQVATRRLCRL